jgi:Fe-S oxidoreductase
MATPVISKKPSFSETFLSSLYDVENGERFRTCLQCGSCSGVCPFGYLMDFPPGRMIAGLRADEFDLVMETDTVWMCVSCYACAQICPSKIPITAGLMTRTKEELLLAGNVPSELQSALENSQRYGNPMGESPRKRADWALGLQPPVSILGRDRRPVEVLWFVGDYPSYHSRVQSVTKSLAKVLNAMGISFGILGPEENSDGDTQRLAGERGLFEMLAEKNGRVFGRYQFERIITSDPHAYNALKNEYPALGISYPVQHYTQFLAERIEQLKPLLKHEIQATITYHDPCYLGRVNGIFDEPRTLLEAIPGIKLVEMAHNHTSSLCCGGGGGGMWLDGFTWEKAHARLSEWRVHEALDSGANILAVACPYEPPRFEDAVKSIQQAEQLVVKDVVELIAEALGE